MIDIIVNDTSVIVRETSEDQARHNVPPRPRWQAKVEWRLHRLASWPSIACWLGVGRVLRVGAGKSLAPAFHPSEATRSGSTAFDQPPNSRSPRWRHAPHVPGQDTPACQTCRREGARPQAVSDIIYATMLCRHVRVLQTSPLAWIPVPKSARSHVDSVPPEAAGWAAILRFASPSIVFRGPTPDACSGPENSMA